MREVELVQGEHVWLKSIYTFIYFLGKWPIFSLDKTLTPRLGLCRALWSYIETAIWTFNQLVPVEVHYMENNPGMFSAKNVISFGLKKDLKIMNDNFYSRS